MNPAPIDEVVDLLRTLRLPHMRAAAPELLATAKAQRWEPAEAMRALLTEELAGRQASSVRARRKAAGFPTGKTFDAWDETASSIPAPTQRALRTLEWLQPSREPRRVRTIRHTARRTSLKRSARPPSMPATRSPGSVSSTSARSCAATALTTPPPKPSSGSCAPTSS